MIQVHPGLFVGNGADYEQVKDDPFFNIVSAAKTPWHCEAVGVPLGKAAPKASPEYLVATRREGRQVILNLLDGDDPKWIDKNMIKAGVKHIHYSLNGISPAQKVLVHCNQGTSRSPMIAMLYLGAIDDVGGEYAHAIALIRFRELYPPLAPARGILGFVQNNWSSRKEFIE